ncbi:MAG: tRNA (adenosine(37)-N6)-threonylcarbamoyltransferase complex transferase subunit TsaD [Candidatus Moranbacteria bacterium]|nr:tRNA (adenosine(37)-N6)-threonylcarbamoyltransferase complex transferase subunit TsaD [Candidatus Moranbacteria bacterium]
MKILTIETSCDETSFAIGEIGKDKAGVVDQVILSQAAIHKKFGGVVPNLSAREHLKNFGPLLRQLLERNKLHLKEFDCVGFTRGPGLIPALLVGSSIAKTLAYFFHKPLIPVSHLEAHIYSNWIAKNQTIRQKIEFPALNLVVSGGHTQLVLMKDHLCYKVLGETLDDAAGEAFDKVARMLNLGYPGGPVVSKRAQKGDENKYNFPTPMIKSRDLNFSFSGLKTAVLYTVKNLDWTKISKAEKPTAINDICASFQKSLVDCLIIKTQQAIKNHNPKTVLLCGGVAANEVLRKKFRLVVKNEKKVHIAEKKYCGDNAAMLIPVLFFKIKKFGLKNFKDSWKNLEPKADWELSDKIKLESKCGKQM